MMAVIERSYMSQQQTQQTRLSISSLIQRPPALLMKTNTVPPKCVQGKGGEHTLFLKFYRAYLNAWNVHQADMSNVQSTSNISWAAYHANMQEKCLHASVVIAILPLFPVCKYPP